MKFAFILLGGYEKEKDYAAFPNGIVQVVGVSTIAEACSTARDLQRGGVACIELCGAFGADGAKEVIAATQNAIPVGYVTHLPEQDALYAAVFPTETPTKA